MKKLVIIKAMFAVLSAIVLAILGVKLALPARAQTACRPDEPDQRCKIIEDPSRTNTIWSTYSPFVMHQPGWDRYRMYFGRNEEIDGYSADRIYLSEDFADGISGWTTPFMVLDIGGAGENRLIHDPSVVVTNEQPPTWHMYYTGTDDPAGYNSGLFHASSSDGVSWQKQGAVVINNLPPQNGQWGYGEPSIIYENGTFRLYYFSDTDPWGQGTLFLAEGTDGHTFQNKGSVSRLIVLNPEVKKYSGKYFVTGNSSFNRFLLASSQNPYWFDSYDWIFQTGPAGSWDSFHIGTPNYLLAENRLYYAGTDDSVTGASDLDNGQIGLTFITVAIPGDIDGDANGDGKVDGFDYIIWLNNYNQQTGNGAQDGDFNGNGKVDGVDYIIWLNNYGS